MQTGFSAGDQSHCLQVQGSPGLPLEHSLPGSGADDWFPTVTGVHRQMKTIGTTAELEQRPDSIQLFSPSSESATTSDPILGGELIIRVIDAQVCSLTLTCPCNLCKTCFGLV